MVESKKEVLSDPTLSTHFRQMSMKAQRKSTAFARIDFSDRIARAASKMSLFFDPAPSVFGVCIEPVFEYYSISGS
jgi:hypothetical protein